MSSLEWLLAQIEPRLIEMHFSIDDSLVRHVEAALNALRVHRVGLAVRLEKTYELQEHSLLAADELQTFLQRKEKYRARRIPPDHRPPRRY